MFVCVCAYTYVHLFICLDNTRFLFKTNFNVIIRVIIPKGNKYKKNYNFAAKKYHLFYLLFLHKKYMQ